MEPPSDFRKLRSSQLRDKLHIKKDYHDFLNNIAFRKGWSAPKFSHKDVDVLFDQAGEIVVRIRSEIDRLNPRWKLRLTIGGAKEYLWAIDEIGSPSNFVRGLVHATFKDEKGYVECLDARIIDKFVDWVFEHQSHCKDAGTYEEKMRRSWNQINTQINRVLNTIEREGTTPEHASHLHSLSQLMERISRQLQAYEKFLNQSQAAKAPAASEAAPAASSAPATSSFPSSAMDTSGAASASSAQAAGSTPADTADTVAAKRSEPTPPPTAVGHGSDSEGASSDPSVSSAPVAPPTIEQAALPEAQPSEEPGMLKVKRVADDVATLSTDVKNLTMESQGLTFENLVTEPVSGAKKVEALQKKCLFLSNELMKELLVLDDVVGSQVTRPARKQQVLRIQETMEDVDQVQSKLRDLLHALQEHTHGKDTRTEEQKRADASAEADARLVKELATGHVASPSPAPAAAESAAETTAATSAPHPPSKSLQVPITTPPSSKHQKTESEEGEATEEMEADATSATGKRRRETASQGLQWRTLKLNPKFDVKEYQDSYVAAGYLPGMRQEDIELSLSKDGGSLTVRGVREPSDEELEVLRRQLRLYLRQQGIAAVNPQEENRALLQMGAGRFGSFAQTFSLPRNTDAPNISASYNSGVLKIVIPKRAPAPRPFRAPAAAAPYGSRAAYAAPPSRGGFPGYGRGGFFEDEDAFW
jgi:HSP20 family protein